MAKMTARDRLLEAAFQLFLVQGVDGTGVEEILKAAEVSRGGLYHHFGSKDGLYEAVLENYFLRGFSEFDAAVFSDLPYEAQREALLSSLTELFDDIEKKYEANKSCYFALFFDSMNRSKLFQHSIQQHYQSLIDCLCAKAISPQQAMAFLRQVEGEIYISTIFDRTPDFGSLIPEGN